MTWPERRSRRIALLLAISAVVLGVVSGIALIWVVAQTDTGMLCDQFPGGADRPAACSLYDAPFWLFGVTAVVVFAAAIAFAVSLLPTRGYRSDGAVS